MREFKQRIESADAVLFVTPEYNRGVPGVLKNAIDVGSRPYGKSAWSGKPGAVISVSPGAIGGFGANHHLRQSLVFLDMPALQQPEAYIGNAGKLFDDDGAIAADDRRASSCRNSCRRSRSGSSATTREVAASARELADHRQRLGDRVIAVARLTACCTQPCRWCSSSLRASASSADCTALTCVRMSTQ